MADEKCILCRAKAEWSITVIHDGLYDCEPLCDRCHTAFDYGFRQALFQNKECFKDEARKYLEQQGVA